MICNDNPLSLTEIEFPTLAVHSVDTGRLLFGNGVVQPWQGLKSFNRLKTRPVAEFPYSFG